MLKSPDVWQQGLRGIDVDWHWSPSVQTFAKKTAHKYELEPGQARKFPKGGKLPKQSETKRRTYRNPARPPVSVSVS